MHFITWYFVALAAIIAIIYFSNDGSITLKIGRVLLNTWLIVAGVVLYAGIFIAPLFIHPDLSLDLGAVIVKDGTVRVFLTIVNIVSAALLMKYLFSKLPIKLVKK